MISTSDFRTGLTIELEGEAFTVVEFQHVKPGKGAAFVRAKIRNVKTGQVLERTFRSGEKMAAARIERKQMVYIYEDGTFYHFMDNETFEQTAIEATALEDIRLYLKENMAVQISFFGTEVVGAELPNSIELTVADTPPDARGDTASGGGKPATLETGAVITVPFFIKVGDVISLNPHTGEYITRV